MRLVRKDRATAQSFSEAEKKLATLLTTEINTLLVDPSRGHVEPVGQRFSIRRRSNGFAIVERTFTDV